ncbi:MAG TPA: hypothetical protein VMU34_16260 [Mycobacterium sp.]|nr:hypothetical protein [Mycobacterium sp.]
MGAYPWRGSAPAAASAGTLHRPRVPGTHVLLPAWCVPGRAVDADTIGSALLAAATGEGYRPIAERLKVPEGTVRGWLRSARAHSGWLYQTAASVLHVVDHDDPVIPPSGRSPLWHAVEALAPPRQRSDDTVTLIRSSPCEAVLNVLRCW